MGLAYLHSEGIVHGDLHGGNILVDNDGHIRLTDFGLALIYDATAYSYSSIHGGGAVRWKAPELIDPEECGADSARPTYKSDVYSYACVVIEVRSSYPHLLSVTHKSIALHRPASISWHYRPSSLHASDEEYPTAAPGASHRTHHS